MRSDRGDRGRFTLPVSGASYTYAYAALGEVWAWALAWMLMLEFGLAGAALAVGFSGYLGSLLADFSVHMPVSLARSTLVATSIGPDSRFTFGASLNLPALLALAAVALVLVRGVRQSAAINTLLVSCKIGILVLFVAFGAPHVDPRHWTPFVPPSEGGFRYGPAGVLRGASVVFFAFLGFEAVATAASEARRRQRDVPIGILGALVVGTLLYAAVAAVLTGLVPFRELGVAFVFCVVAISTICLRNVHPDLERPFRVPLGVIMIRDVWIGTMPACAFRRPRPPGSVVRYEAVGSPTDLRRRARGIDVLAASRNLSAGAPYERDAVSQTVAHEPPVVAIATEIGSGPTRGCRGRLVLQGSGRGGLS